MQREKYTQIWSIYKVFVHAVSHLSNPKEFLQKKKKKKKHHLSESKTLDKNFHSRSNEKYFREFFTNYTESKKKKEITIG